MQEIPVSDATKPMPVQRSLINYFAMPCETMTILRLTSHSKDLRAATWVLGRRMSLSKQGEQWRVITDTEMREQVSGWRIPMGMCTTCQG